MSAAAPALGFDAFSQTGCLVFERFFPPALITAIHDEYLRQYSDHEVAQAAPHLKVDTNRLHLPIAMRGPLLDPLLYAHPLLLRLLQPLLESRFVIDSVNIVTSFPGSPRQRIHRDHPGLFPEKFGGMGEPTYLVVVAIPLVDLTPETGTTQLFPGSMGIEMAPYGPTQFGSAVAPYLNRGGCLMYDYRVYHQGLENVSDQPRPVLFISFARHWFTDIINFRKHARIVMDRASLARVPLEHRPLFARLAAKSGLDLTDTELELGEAG
jgi:hypothetical protein